MRREKAEISWVFPSYPSSDSFTEQETSLEANATV